jgi:hypothetical protein
MTSKCILICPIDYNNNPLPDVNVDHLLESRSHIELSNPLIQTISIEVLSIIGSTATATSQDTNIFYDAEVLAVIHRYKSKLDGLVSTNLWIWRGKRSQTNDKEERKIQDLARRYGTSPVGHIGNFILVLLTIPADIDRSIFRTSTVSIPSWRPTSYPSSEADGIMSAKAR